MAAGSTPNGTDRLDTVGMWDLTAGLPEQVRTAAANARGIDGLPDKASIEHVVVLGMGGSGVSGDILTAAAGPFMSVPVTVTKSYELPAFVGDGSLVFAISCSGNTEETIEARARRPISRSFRPPSPITIPF